MSIADEIARMVGGGNANPTHQATVLRTDPDGTTWVSIAGGADETPLRGVLAECRPGDSVEVAISGGKAVATANATSPAATVRSMRAVDGRVADVSKKVVGMQSDVDLASQAATEAKAVAQATGQHFWEDSNGAHVTEITKDEWKAEEAKSNPFSDVSDAKPYHNLLMNSLGILLRTALKNLVSITRSAIAFFDGDGNDASNVVASFGKDGFQVGTTGESHLVGDYHSLKMIDRNGNTFYHISDLRNENGFIVDEYVADGSQTRFQGSVPNWSGTEHHVKLDNVETTTGFTWTNGAEYGPVVSFDTPPTNGSIVAIEYYPYPLEYAKAYTVGLRKVDSACGMMSYAEGVNCEASGYVSHAEGIRTAALGRSSHAEGQGSTADGICSHAEGQGCEATGNYCHAEGNSTTANWYANHAEGQGTTATQMCSHAEGQDSTASASWSHAQNLDTIAASQAQTAIGKYNVEDANGNYALIIGKGTSDSARSNALTVDWRGNVNVAGNVTAANIGDVVSASKGSTSTANSDYVDLTSFRLEAGTWMVFATFEFATNTTGRRVAYLNTTAGGAGISLQWRATESGVAGGPTRPKLAGVLTPTATTTYYLTSWQNSGGALSVSCACQAVRIR